MNSYKSKRVLLILILVLIHIILISFNTNAQAENEKISLGEDSTTKVLNSIIPTDIPTPTAVQAPITANLEPIFADGDCQARVTKDLTLPLIDENGNAVVWTSSDNTVIKIQGDKGVVSRKIGKETVVLTANITNNSVTITKDYILKIEGKTFINSYDNAVLVKREDGTVWGWGRNSNNYFNTKNADSYLKTPERLGYPNDVLDVTKISNYVIENGEVYRTNFQNNDQEKMNGLSDIICIVSGDLHTLALKKDGTVWAWGDNQYNQLGDGTHIYKDEPVKVMGIYDVIDIYSYKNNSIALKKDGTVWKWGEGLTEAIPLRVEKLDNVIEIGENFFIKKDRTLWCYGKIQRFNSNYTNNITIPIEIKDISGVKKMVGSILTQVDGNVWEFNYYSDYDNSIKATLIKRIDIKDVAYAGTIMANSYYAVKEDGTLLTCGVKNLLGDGSTEDRNEFRAIKLSLTDKGSVEKDKELLNIEYYGGDSAEGVAFNVNLPQKGFNETIITWVSNNTNIINNEGKINLPKINTQVVLTATITKNSFSETKNFILNVKEKSDEICTQLDEAELKIIYEKANNANNVRQNITLPQVGSHNTSITWTSDNNELIEILNNKGIVKQNMFNRIAQLTATISKGNKITIKKFILKIKGKTSISAGFRHTVILKDDGTVWACGLNEDGQLGDGTNEIYSEKNYPVKVKGISDVIEVSAGMYHTLALKADGTVWAWGNNTSGQLGNGTNYINSNKPIQVAGLSNIISISANGGYSVALKDDGTLFEWGDRRRISEMPGAKGSVLPIKLEQLTNIIDISTGEQHTVALKNDGTVWVWGCNDFNLCGDGFLSEYISPKHINSLSNIISIGASNSYNNAVKVDGTVWIWGASKQFTTQLEGISDVVDISVGKSHAIYVKRDGTLWGFNNNWCGQLGDGTYIFRDKPVRASVILNAADLSVGDEYTAFIKEDGSVWGVGDGSSGQIGNRAFGNQRNTEPVYIGINVINPKEANCLSSLIIGEYQLTPSFNKTTESYTSIVENCTLSINLTPVTQYTNASVTVNGIAVQSGKQSQVIPLEVGNNIISVVVTAYDGTTTKTYTINIERKQKELDRVVRKGGNYKVTVAVQRPYNDITGHWAEKAIQKAADADIIDNTPEKPYKPDEVITRAEFAKMCVRLLKLPITDEKGSFNDALGSDDEKYIIAVVKAGIIQGYEDNTFRPNRTITREELCTLIARTYKLTPTKENPSFTDANEIAEYAKGYITTLSNKSIIKGYPDNTFKPRNNLTRAEAVSVLVRAMGLLQ